MEQPTNTSTDIVEQIDREIARMMQQVARLQDARAVLVPVQTAPRPQRKPRRRAATSSQDGRRTRVPVGDREAAILHILDNAEGEMTTNEVADAVGISRTYASTILRGLAKGNQVNEQPDASRSKPSTWTAKKRRAKAGVASS